MHLCTPVCVRMSVRVSCVWCVVCVLCVVCVCVVCVLCVCVVCVCAVCVCVCVYVMCVWCVVCVVCVCGVWCVCVCVCCVGVGGCGWVWVDVHRQQQADTNTHTSSTNHNGTTSHCQCRTNTAHTNMLCMSSDRLVSKRRNTFPFFWQPCTSVPAAKNTLSVTAPGVPPSSTRLIRGPGRVLKTTFHTSKMQPLDGHLLNYASKPQFHPKHSHS